MLFNPKLGGEGVCTFPKGIRPKVIAVTLLEFELIYYDVAVPHFSHDATRSLLFALRLVWETIIIL